jgi:hypothetical protein
MSQRWHNHWTWDAAAGIASVPFSIGLVLKSPPGGVQIGAVIVAIFLPIAIAAKIWNRWSDE